MSIQKQKCQALNIKLKQRMGMLSRLHPNSYLNFLRNSMLFNSITRILTVLLISEKGWK